MNLNLHQLRLGAAPCAIALAFLSTPAFAQEAPAEADADVIVVTGSRIARPDLDSPVPLAVITADALENKGQTNLYDALRDNPIAGTNTLDRSGSNFQNFDIGAATVNLRNLGTSRTLTLINGRRSIGLPGDTAVDLNVIPTDLIERVEIVTGGTSAVYGSDAIAGVVNIILNDKFEGLQIHGQAGISGKGDAGSRFISATGGISFAEGAGHLVANLSYEDNDALPARNRAYSAYDTPSNSSYAAQGIFDTSFNGFSPDATGHIYTFTPNNAVKLYEGPGIDGYRRANDRLLVIPLKRYTAMALGSYEFSPAATVYAEASFSRTKANGAIEALAVDNSGNPGQGVLNLDGSVFEGIPVTNPLIPAAIRDAAIAQGSTLIDFRRRSVEIFDRSTNETRDYYRGVIGIKGEFAPGWRYDASYEHSEYHTDTTSEAILLNNYGAALDATTIGGKVVCADPAARAAGCVPINIFGFNTVTPEQVKWLSTYSGIGLIAPGASPGDPVYSEFRRKSSQDVVSATVSGSLFNLPAGPVGIAVGVEYHREKAEELYDPYTIAGISSSQQATNTVGQYDSKEIYGEVRVPIFKDQPFLHEVTLEGAVRYVNYSTVGGAWTYKFGGTWAPVPDLRFRAMYARAVRAPNINELFAQQSLTAIQVIDPCDQNNGEGDTVREGGLLPLPSACRTIPGISNYLQTHPNFTYSLAQVQSAFGYLGGNLNLTPEATKTFTVGGTFRPSFLRGFDLSVDYYNVKVLNAIAAVDQQTSVTQCIETGDPQFCSSVFRDANGFIKQVDSINLNASSYEVAGLDVQVHYAARPHIFSASDRLLFTLFYNHKFKQQQTPFVGGPVTDELGTADQYAGSQLGTGFKDQFTFNTEFGSGPFSLSYKLRYLGPVTASSGVFAIPGYWYHDAQIKFDIDGAQKFQFYLGVNNIFDKQPPLITSGNGQWPGTNTVADTYDLYGRMLYAGFKAKF